MSNKSQNSENINQISILAKNLLRGATLGYLNKKY